MTFLRPGLFCLSAKEIVVTPSLSNGTKSVRPAVYPLYVLVS